LSTAIFPTLPGQLWPKRTPEWSTRTQEAISGKQTRVSLWSYPRWTWELSFEMLRSIAATPEFQTLVNFYNGRQGSFDSFLFTDPSDNAVTGQGLGIGDGHTTSFQLVRAFGGIGGFVEPIWAPNLVSNVYVGGVVQSPASWQVNGWGTPSPGQVIFTTAPATGLIVSADFSFYFPCRFTEDQVEFEEFMAGLWMAKSLKFQSLK